MRVGPTLEQLKKDYNNEIKVVFKNLIVHPGTATIPALASCAANLQGKFEPMYDLIWEKGFNAGRNLSQDNMEKLAGELGLNMSKFKADMEGDCKKIVEQEQSEMRAVGARGTPAFFINGRFLSGAQPIENFKAIIDDELKKANDRIAKGTSVENYYEEWVMKKGKKTL
ncbi:MAG TPA: DsbA family protein [Kofleriaceae bacterium]|nr:DsbA family protein [Kofleriaceae bacterium]